MGRLQACTSLNNPCVTKSLVRQEVAKQCYLKGQETLCSKIVALCSLPPEHQVAQDPYFCVHKLIKSYLYIGRP